MNLEPKEYGPTPRTKLGKQVNFFVDGRTIEQSVSRNLSEACQAGRFNQKRPGRYFSLVPMSDGTKKRFGYANSEGFNLRARAGLTGNDQAYLFDLDGTSECKVYAFATVF